MPRKNQKTMFHGITNGDMSATSLTSTVSSIEFVDDVGIQFNWTGSPVGTFQVQVSIDYSQDTEGNVQNTGHWTPLIFTYWNGATFTTTADIPTSVGSPIYLDMALLSAPWIRYVYTKVSGTGTLQGYITYKSVSG